MVSGLGAMLNDAPTITLLTSAPTKAVADGWLKILSKQLVAGGVPKEKLVAKACVGPIKFVKTTIVRGETSCEALAHDANQ